MKKRRLFFDARMYVALPGGADLFLLGIKSHDSEIRLCRFLINRLNAGMHVVDIGAHFGYYSLLFSGLVGPAGRILAIEPSAFNNRILRLNTRALANIEINDSAASQHKGQAEFLEGKAEVSESSHLKYPNEILKLDDSHLRKVETRSVDKLVRDYRIKPDLIKIDTEGSEANIIQGMRETLSGQRPVISMEILSPDPRGIYSDARLILEQNGYEMNGIDQHGGLFQIEDLDAHFLHSGLTSDNFVFIPSG